jgi:hypothetical protein
MRQSPIDGSVSMLTARAMSRTPRAQVPLMSNHPVRAMTGIGRVPDQQISGQSICETDIRNYAAIVSS